MKKLVAAFAGLSTLDIILTLIFVGNGTSRELNAYMENVLAWPLPFILLFKIGLPLLLGLALIAISRTRANQIVRPRGVLITVVIVLIGVCLFNAGGLLV